MHAAIHKAHQQMHKHLKLQHHRHTGRHLHHEHTSYRGLTVVLVLASVVMLGITYVQRAAADELFSVGATVMAPVPTTGAIINTPSDTSTVTSSDTLVAGSCPLISPQVTVVLQLDGGLAGSATCNDSNEFALPIRLTPGAHTLVGQVFTITGGQGPDSQTTHLTYTAAHSATTAGLVLTPTAPFTVLEGDSAADWTGTVTGGTAPYHTIVEWGDGSRNAYTFTTANIQLSHRYTKIQSYNARVAVSDANGHSAQQQYAAFAYSTASSVTDATDTSAADPLVTPTVAGLYGLFLTVLSVTAIVWLEARHAAQHQVMAV